MRLPRDIIPIARPKFINCPPPLGSPPLREGNRERRAYSVPPARRGNLQEGVINCCFFVSFGLAIGISVPTRKLLWRGIVI